MKLAVSQVVAAMCDAGSVPIRLCLVPQPATTSVAGFANSSSSFTFYPSTLPSTPVHIIAALSLPRSWRIAAAALGNVSNASALFFSEDNVSLSSAPNSTIRVLTIYVPTPLSSSSTPTVVIPVVAHCATQSINMNLMFNWPTEQQTIADDVATSQSSQLSHQRRD